jgi:hypothetical protein
MNQFPWGVSILLGVGLVGTLFCIIYILRLAHLEMQDETPESDSINNKSEH